MRKAIRSIVDYSGVGGALINVECHITNGLPAVVIIGYASKAVDEARERLRASFSNCALNFPKKRITINLSPADIPKDSTSLDLAMAVAILAQSGQIDNTDLNDTIFLGEISLDGALNAVRGIVGRILVAKKMGFSKFYLPKANLEQALLIPDIAVKATDNLKTVYLDLSGISPLKSMSSGKGRLIKAAQNLEVIDFAEISGQPIAKRALEIAAAGHHNILLYGPPGTGKTMLAKALCGILPALTHEEILEVTHLHSLGGNEHDQIVSTRPFRSPHHTTSTIALVGGGPNPKPGEASLAHRGVLFLDELPEFSHSSLEALRQPLEDGSITIARIRDSATYPAEFILVATQNPCPCGYWGTPKPCSCTAAAIARYQKRVSGPILDRIDLHLSVQGVNHSQLLDSRNRQSETIPIKKRVENAYATQRKRFKKSKFNGSMSNKEIRELARLSPQAKQLLDTASAKLGLSARAYVRVVKVSRTIADLGNELEILPQHIGEALQYRQQTAV